MELDLNEIRQTIDETDEQLVALFEKRMALASQVAAYKKERKLPILDSKREAMVTEKNILRLSNKAYAPYLADFLKELMQISRSYQSTLLVNDTTSWQSVLGNLPVSEIIKNPKVGYGGTVGSYGEMAALDYFKESQPIAYQTFEEVVNDVLEGKLDYGVSPLENTSSGGVLDVVRLLERLPVYIVGETAVAAEHCLLGLDTIEDIDTVYSHVQGFLQCSEYLKDKSWRQVPYFNTAISAAYVQKCNDKRKVAIASKRAAEVYGLKVLKEAIYHNDKNYTRFGIIKKSMELSDAANKISIDFVLDHKKGSLYPIIKTIADHHLNMMKIESNPILGKPWEYVFFIDFSGNLRDNEVKRALLEIKENSKQFHFKGNYIKNTGGINMGTEFEIKLGVENETLMKEILSDAVINNLGEFSIISMHAYYYDTAALDLLNVKYSLRVRKENGDYVATLKTGHFSESKGVFLRNEWNVPLKSKEFTIDVFENEKEDLKSITKGDRLKVILETDFIRRKMDITYGASTLELAVDHGRISSGKRQSPICEVEVELKEGREEDVFGFIEKYLSKYKLPMEEKSKFSRGVSLYLGM